MRTSQSEHGRYGVLSLLHFQGPLHRPPNLKQKTIGARTQDASKQRNKLSLNHVLPRYFRPSSKATSTDPSGILSDVWPGCKGAKIGHGSSAKRVRGLVCDSHHLPLTPEHLCLQSLSFCKLMSQSAPHCLLEVQYLILFTVLILAFSRCLLKCLHFPPAVSSSPLCFFFPLSFPLL